MKKIIPIIVTAAAFILTFTATAHAAAAIEPSGGSLLDLLQPVYLAFSEGHYLWAGATCLVLVVALARRYGTEKLPWLSTDAGSAFLVLAGSFGAALATSLTGGIQPTWAMAFIAFKVAFMAAGGYASLKALIIKPYVTYLATKGPSWMHAPAQLILWVFQETGIPQTPAQQAVAAVAAINRPDSDVVVSVTTPSGSAVASSPAVAPAAPISVVSDVPLVPPKK